MEQIFETVMAPATGWAGVVKTGQRLRVTDLEGLQVVDMAVFNEHNLREKLSTSYSRTHAGMNRLDDGDGFHPRDRLLEGDALISTINSEMMRIVADTAEVKGMHDVHGRMCNRHLYAALGAGEKDGCHEIIAGVVAPWDLRAEDIPDTIDLFMNFHHSCAHGWWELEDGVSKPGDYIEFEALMDCVVALSNCPFYRGTPMKVEIFGGEAA